MFSLLTASATAAAVVTDKIIQDEVVDVLVDHRLKDQSHDPVFEEASGTVVKNTSNDPVSTLNPFDKPLEGLDCITVTTWNEQCYRGVWNGVYGGVPISLICPETCHIKWPHLTPQQYQDLNEWQPHAWDPQADEHEFFILGTGPLAQIGEPTNKPYEPPALPECVDGFVDGLPGTAPWNGWAGHCESLMAESRWTSFNKTCTGTVWEGCPKENGCDISKLCAYTCSKMGFDTCLTALTEENFAYAETSVILDSYVKKIGAGTGTDGMGVYLHLSGAMDPTDKTVLRPNFDTLYSFAVVDLESPATIILPQTDRYQILEVIDEEHWIPLITSEPGAYTLTKDNVGSRYAFAFVRTQVNMKDPVDVAAAASIMKEIVIKQAHKGEWTKPHSFNYQDILKMRGEYNEKFVAKGLTAAQIFGKRGELDPTLRNHGVALGWGGLPKEGAVYPLPAVVHSEEHHTITLKDVPCEEGSFWSVTVYDGDGFVAGEYYNVNSAFAKPSADGSYVMNFGGSPQMDNHLSIEGVNGWNVAVRIYSPTEEFFNGGWTLPQLVKE